MSQCCGKVTSDDDAKAIRASIEGRQKNFQGDIGEQVVYEKVVDELNINAEFFDKRKNGFDGVGRMGGKLVIIESKFTKASGRSALGYTKHHGREGSVEWVEHYATLMSDPTSSYYTPDNAKIGREILEIGAANVPFIIGHISPDTLEFDHTWLR